MMKPKREIVSRRNRPAKEALSHELIVKTAYDLLKEEGTSGMSMRKIAKQLDTGPSSLYVYVKNLQELSSYVLDLGLGELHLPELTDDNWKEQLSQTLYGYAMLLIEQPGLAELSLRTIPIGDNAFRLNEYLLAVLQKGGIFLHPRLGEQIFCFCTFLLLPWRRRPDQAIKWNAPRITIMKQIRSVFH